MQPTSSGETHSACLHSTKKHVQGSALAFFLTEQSFAAFNKTDNCSSHNLCIPWDSATDDDDQDYNFLFEHVSSCNY